MSKKSNDSILGTFLDGIIQTAVLSAVVRSSSDIYGRPDRDKAAGMAWGMGYTSWDAIGELSWMLDRAERNAYVEDDFWRRWCEDGLEYGLSPYDFSSKEEYYKALYQAKYGWREHCEDGSEYSIYPEDYEDEEDYNDDLYDAKYKWRNTYDWRLEDSIDPEDYETEEEYLEAVENYEPPPHRFHDERHNYDRDETNDINPNDYKTKAAYVAAHHLVSVDDGYIIYLDEACKQREQEICRFVIENQELPAAKYLFVGKGFMYYQAIQDRFKIADMQSLSFEEMSVTDFISSYSFIDGQKAFEIWKWCIEVFFPWRQYSEGFALNNGLIYNWESISEEFVSFALTELANNVDLCALIMTFENVTEAAAYLIYKCLERNELETAKIMIGIFLELHAGKIKNVSDMMEKLLSYCENYDSAKEMKSFQDAMLALLNENAEPELRKKKAKWEQRAEKYYEELNRPDDPWLE